MGFNAIVALAGDYVRSVVLVVGGTRQYVVAVTVRGGEVEPALLLMDEALKSVRLERPLPDPRRGQASGLLASLGNAS